MQLPLTPVQWGVAGTLLGIVVWVVYALLKGKLVPRRIVEDIRRDNLEIIDSWKDAVSKRDQVIAEVLPTLNEIKDLTKTNIHLINELKIVVGKKAGGRDA